MAGSDLTMIPSKAESFLQLVEEVKLRFSRKDLTHHYSLEDRRTV